MGRPQPGAAFLAAPIVLATQMGDVVLELPLQFREGEFEGFAELGRFV